MDVSAHQDKDVLKSKVLEIVALNNEEAYEDEYDDSFDDLGPGTRMGYTECEDATHSSPTLNSMPFALLSFFCILYLYLCICIFFCEIQCSNAKHVLCSLNLVASTSMYHRTCLVHIPRESI